MVGKNHSAQALTIRLLQRLDTLDRQAVYRQALQQLEQNTEARELLQLCVMMAGELKAQPEKYNSFESLSRTILARLKREVKVPLDDTREDISTVQKKDVGKAMDLSAASANKLITRINEHERELKVQEIQALVAGFQKSSNRIFWKNLIYFLFPELSAPEDAEDSSIQDCLQAVWNSLTQEEQNSAYYSLLPDRSWFDQLKQSAPEAPAEEKEEEEPGLYDMLEACMAAQKHKYVNGIKTEVYNSLCIDPDTYLAYKKHWKKYENGEGPLPGRRRRLSRKQLLFLALFLRMDFYTTALLLAKGGYAFHYEKADILVANYLLKHAGSRVEIMEDLLLPE